MFSSKIRNFIFGAVIVFTSALINAQTCTEPTGSQFRTVTLATGGGLNTGEYQGGAASGVVQMAIAPDTSIFIAKMRTGDIYLYKPSVPNTTALIGTIPTFFQTEDGLLGIALDPNFKTTKWIYALYSDPSGLTGANRACELARFTYDPSQPTTGLGQLTNKKVLLRFPRRTNDSHHAAGGLAIDSSGTMVIGTGDNTDPANSNNGGYGPFYWNTTAPADAQITASNTNDLRGKVLRIKLIAFPDNQTPTPGIGGTYNVPTGNLWEKINNSAFNPHWDNTDSISKVRKEIYTFGHRNPYHPRIDTRSGWVFWGEVGPDARTINSTRGPFGDDEWNLAIAPGFYGHPYCNGAGAPYASMTYPLTAYGKFFDCRESGNSSLEPLVNMSPNNTGIHHMPPAIPALAAYGTCTSAATACIRKYWNGTDTIRDTDDVRFNSTYGTTGNPSYNSASAIGGPMYRYDMASTSNTKFPPYYEGKILFFDWPRRTLRWININPDGTIPVGADGVHNFAPTGFVTASYADMQFGPDGAMYALQMTTNGYSSSSAAVLYRVEYTGTYDNSCYKQFVATVGPGPISTVTSVFPNRPKAELKSVTPFANSFLRLPEGYKTVQLYDISGRMVWSFHREQSNVVSDVKLPANLAKGLFQAKLLP